MSARNWFDALKSRFTPAPNRRQRRASASKGPAARRLQVETLEDRRVLAFAPVVDYAVGPNPQAMVAADFNNDTLPDLAVANYASGNVSVLLANPDGTFQPPLTSPAGGSPLSLAVGDFNEDGKLDLATANYFDVTVMLGDGAGSFGAPTSMGVAGNPQSVAVGDFNGDGKLDLGVTSNYYTYWGYYYYGYGYSEGYANVLLGNANGTFSAAQSTYLGFDWHYGALAADLNGDAYDDFVTSNVYYGYVEVLLGSSSGYLQPTSYLYTADSSYSVAAADLDGDGDNDLLAANFYGGSVGVFQNDGVGGFSDPTSYPTGGNPASLAVGDFTGDGSLDVLASNYYSGQVSLLYGDGGGALFAPVQFAVGTNPWVVASGDFNGDGWLDAATANYYGNSISVLLNDGVWAAAPASLSIDNVTVTEGDSGTVAAVFTVTRGGENFAGSVSVNYATANGGALAGSDYVAQSGTLTFADGESTKTITILVNGDLTDEFDQGFFVNLSGASSAVILDGQGIGTILDNDDAPTITITPLVSEREGNNNSTKLFQFVVTLSAPSEKQVQVSYSTANGTASTADSDYFAKSGTLTFAPGTTSQTISVQVRGDKRKEANETFFVNLTGASNATIATAQAIGEILDDDSPGGKGKPN